MKIVRYSHENDTCYGVLKNERVYMIKGDIFSVFRIQEKESVRLEKLRVLAPVSPTKIIAVGINYRDHAQEFNHHIPKEPVLFMKPATAVIGPGDAVVLPSSSKRVDYEAELAAVVKKEAYKIDQDDAQDYILGYTCLNDVTARDLQRTDGQWTRSKSFNTFCPIGPAIETELDPNNVNVRSRLNGIEKQSSNTRNFIFPMFFLLSFVSFIMKLNPGDIISTGTPSGVGPMKDGDIVEIEVEGIGVLRNPVRSDE
jgi:2-keto-4-pentenoate hydratase/2-oxohepta-3-ene-1,7-dioic acid hydratase in catechol pathway